MSQGYAEDFLLIGGGGPDQFQWPRSLGQRVRVLGQELGFAKREIWQTGYAVGRYLLLFLAVVVVSLCCRLVGLSEAEGWFVHLADVPVVF